MSGAESVYVSCVLGRSGEEDRAVRIGVDGVGCEVLRRSGDGILQLQLQIGG